MHVFAVHLMDRDLAADIGPPLVWLGPRVALRGRKKQDVAAEPSRKESSCEPTVLFHDLDDCCDLMFLEVREDVSFLAQDVQRARDLQRRIA